MECKKCKELLCVAIYLDCSIDNNVRVDGFKVYEKEQKCLNGTEKEKN